MINLRYSIPEAQNTSRMGVPVALHVYGITGSQFVRGQLVQLSAGNTTRVFTGINLTVPSNMLGLITPIEHPVAPGLTLAKGLQTLPPGFSGDINFELTSVGSTSLLEYGMKIAELYFVELKA